MSEDIVPIGSGDTGVSSRPNGSMEFQLRRYRIRQGCLDEFVTVWREQLVPLRESFGFVIVGAWTIPEENEFVWIVAHERMETASAEYYESPDRTAVSPPPRDLLETVSFWPIVPAVEG